MPFCIKCGNEIAENAIFCQKCGNATQSEQVPTQSSDTVENTDAENLSLWGYFLKCFKKYANFKGRARRKEFWGFLLLSNVFGYALLFAGILISGEDIADVFESLEDANLGTVLCCLCLYGLAVMLPSLAVLFRRLHDTGRSGWIFLWYLIISTIGLPIVLLPFLLVGEAMVYSVLYAIGITIGAFYMVYLLCIEGDAVKNKYGPSTTFPDDEPIIRYGWASWENIRGGLYLTADNLQFIHGKIHFSELEIKIEQIKDVSLIPNGLAITTLDGKVILGVDGGKLWKEEIEKIKSKAHEKKEG